MAGNREGGQKAAATVKAKYGEGFYARIGQKGGRNGKTGGFASNVVGEDGLTGRERAKIAGSKGGKISKRGKGKVKQELEVLAEEIKEEKKGFIKWFSGKKW